MKNLKTPIIFILINLIFSYNIIAQEQKIKDGSIFLPIDQNVATITINGFRDLGYNVFNNPIPHNHSKETQLKVSVNGREIRYNNKPVLIYPSGNPFIEAKRIEVSRINGLDKHNAYINYNFAKDKNNIGGLWAFNGNNGPSLLVSMSKPRGVRIYMDQFEPKFDKIKRYKFKVIVDGVPVGSKLTNSSSIDVFGKEVYILLISWPPNTTPVRVVGSFSVFE